MTMDAAFSSRLTDRLLAGVAIVYIRQSSPYQVKHNVGSAAHQRSLLEKLKRLGFPEERIVMMDEDLGCSSTIGTHRSGWDRMGDAILNGWEGWPVTVVAMSEFSRFGRDCLEVQRFFRDCEQMGVLLLENETLRDLRVDSDWTLAMLQAVLAEQANRKRVADLQNAKRAKARQGFVVSQLPAGFDREPDGIVVKTRDDAVRERLEYVWQLARQGLSARRIAKQLQREGRELPARAFHGGIKWNPVSRHSVHQILNNPLYGGIIALGRYGVKPGLGGKRSRRTPREKQEWIEGKVEGYVTPEEYRQLRAQKAARLPTGPAWGEGRALGVGLIRCGKCGSGLAVRYTHRKRYPGRRYHGYICCGAGEADGLATCMFAPGMGLDRVIEEIVLAALRCPSPTQLRRAIQEENARRQGEHRLLGAEVRKARAKVEEARALLEESRRDGATPRVTKMYREALETAIRGQEEAERRAAATPSPPPLDASPAFLGAVAAKFRDFPQLWRRLGPRERKAIIARVIRRIDIPAKGETMLVRVTLQWGQVIERVVYLKAGRRRLMEALAAAGRSSTEIVAELDRRGIVNNSGRPFNVKAVDAVLGRQLARGRSPAEEALQALWAQGLPQAQIAAQLNARGIRRPRGGPWTTEEVLRVAKRLGLPPRWEVLRELLRAPLVELVQAAWEDAAIAEEFIARGLPSYSGGPFTATMIERLRYQLRILRPSGHRPRVVPSNQEAA